MAEKSSVADYLKDTLAFGPSSKVGLLSFNQWYWTTAAITETALAAHSVGASLTVAWWADHTPLHDPGWRLNRWVCRLLRSPSIENSAQSLLESVGISRSAFVSPPLQRHTPSQLPAIPEPLTRGVIRSLSYMGTGMGRSILQVHPDFDTPIRDDFVWPRRWVDKAVRSYAWVYDQTRALIQARHLSTIVVFNGRFTHDRAAAEAAKALGAQVLYYDTGGLDTAFDLTDHTTLDWDALQERMTDLWSRWGGDREAIAHAWFAHREDHSEPGIDVFVGLQEANHLPELPAGRKLVVFFSSSGDEMAEMDLDWSKYFQSQEHAVRTLAQVCSELPDTTLVVRTHPHMRLKPADDLKGWVDAIDSIGHIIHIPPDSPADSYALMRRADRVITYGSTSGIEAAYRNRPVAVMGPSAYQLLGCVTPVHSADDLKRWLTHDQDTHPENSLLYGLMMQRRGFHHEWLQPCGDGQFGRNGFTLTDATPVAQKTSHFLNTFATKWLTLK